MIYGRSRRHHLQVPPVSATLIIPMSALRNSTDFQCSYRASGKAESSFLVRATFPRSLPYILLTNEHVAPKPVTRHLVVTARAAEPTRPSSGDTPLQNAPREAYPDEVLTHRFRPYGAPHVVPPPAPPEHQMDDHGGHVVEGAKEKEKEKRKKRRGETGESPKKLKRVKTATASSS